jgi:hypothetical protein
MNRPFRRYARKIAVGVVLLGLAAWIVPTFFSAEHYHDRLQAALERALGRPVKFESISFHLLPVPGFTITGALISEVSPFGSEPFAQAERVDCDLRWRSLWDRRLDVSRLALDHASLNLVRDSSGEWNIESLFERSRPKTGVRAAGNRASRRGGLDVVANDARLNFTLGQDTKPLAITGVQANVHVDPGSGQVSFRLAGSPVRTDLSMPTPGPVELVGKWMPSVSPGGVLDARLATHGALLYDWIPLVSGHNLGLYGVLDSEVQLTGSLLDIRFQGDTAVRQLHSWDALPPSKPMPLAIHFLGSFDRAHGQLHISRLDVAFAHSRFHVSGAVLGLPYSPHLDLVATLERSHLEDLLDLGRRTTGKQGAWGVSGSVNGLVTVQGLWNNPRYAGFLTARAVRLTTPAADFPVSRLAVTIDRGGARVAPFRILVAPNVEASASARCSFPRSPGGRGAMTRAAGGYELRVSARAVPLDNLLRAGHAFGWDSFRNIAAKGVAQVNLLLSGKIEPFVAPAFTARVQLERTRLLVPGLTEPVNVPRATVTLTRGRVVADPAVAVIGTSVFSGRLAHQDSPEEPWEFSIQANHLSLNQGAGWFEAFGENKPLQLLSRLPGFGSLLQRHQAALSLFTRLYARGTFTTPDLTYHQVNLRRFRAQVEIRRRVIRITHAAFRAGGGYGSGMTVVNLRVSPAQLNGRLALEGAGVRTIAPTLSAGLAGARGRYSIEGRFEARGLTRQQMADSLRGSGTIRARNLTLGNFDLVGNLAQFSGLGTLVPLDRPAAITPAFARFEIRDRKITLQDAAIKVGGATVALAGSYTFDGAIRLHVQADLRHLRRPWLRPEVQKESADGLARLNLVGNFGAAMKTPQWSLPVTAGTSRPPHREAF